MSPLKSPHENDLIGRGDWRHWGDVQPFSEEGVVKELFAIVSIVGLLTSADVAGESKREPLQGVWQAVEVTVTGPAARTITIPEPRANLIILSAKHYGRVEIHAEGPRPAPADMMKASADELRAVWGPFAGEAGTDEVAAGNVITMRPLVAKNPAAMAPGAFVTSYKLVGDTLWVTFQKNQNGPIINPVTVKAVRIE
jgi:hypothetical protein